MSKSFILGKKQPTLYSRKVAPCVLEDKDLCFAACGNTIKVSSLRTGFCVKTIRQSLQNEKLTDVHKSDILSMTIQRNPQKQLRLTTVCARGTVAEWDPET